LNNFSFFSFFFPRHFQYIYIYSFSGDCRPSLQFAEIGSGSHLILHEATFDSELIYEAISKKHTTISEAISIGSTMNPQGHLLLTHFSQRYPKTAKLEYESHEYNDIYDTQLQQQPHEQQQRELEGHSNDMVEEETKIKRRGERRIQIGHAQDLMRIPLNDFWKLDWLRRNMHRIIKDMDESDDENDDAVV